jgi:hypothetical protein
MANGRNVRVFFAYGVSAAADVNQPINRLQVCVESFVIATVCLKHRSTDKCELVESDPHK